MENPESIEFVSRDNLVALQLKRLKLTLKNAYENVTFYKKSFDKNHVHPDDLKELADLGKFPFLTKQDLRNTYPYGLFAVPREQIVRIHASSGTTGKPTIVGYTKNDLHMWSEVIARSLRSAGCKKGDTLHIAFGYGLFTGGLGLHYGSEKLGCTTIPMSGGQTEKQVQLIKDLSPRIIAVTPSYMLAIAEEFRNQGLDPKQSSLQIGIHGAEPWSEAMREEIQEVFSIDAVDLYGLSEVIGPGVACESVDDKGSPYIWEDHFYPEIIDPETGEVLPEGTAGELVWTSLTKEAQPVIRYRSRDRSKLFPGAARVMRQMERISGRTDDMLIIRGVNVFPTQIEEILVADKHLTPHYLLEVRREGILDTLDILVESKMGHLLNSPKAKSAVQNTVERRIKSMVGVTAKVTVVQDGIIERSSGKATRIIDKRSG